MNRLFEKLPHTVANLFVSATNQNIHFHWLKLMAACCLKTSASNKRRLFLVVPQNCFFHFCCTSYNIIHFSISLACLCQNISASDKRSEIFLFFFASRRHNVIPFSLALAWNFSFLSASRRHNVIPFSLALAWNFSFLSASRRHNVILFSLALAWLHNFCLKIFGLRQTSTVSYCVLQTVWVTAFLAPEADVHATWHYGGQLHLQLPHLERCVGHAQRPGTFLLLLLLPGFTLLRFLLCFFHFQPQNWREESLSLL